MKAWLAAILLIGSVALVSASASAQVYPTCPPGYVFAQDGLCYPASYGYNPYYYDPGYYPFYPEFGYSPFFFGGGFGGFHRFDGFHHFHHGFVGHRFAFHGGGHFGGRR